jgi:hypothetical protein
MGSGATAHNWYVYASPPVGGSGCGLVRSFRFAHSHAKPLSHFGRTTKLQFAYPPSKCRKQPERYVQ